MTTLETEESPASPADKALVANPPLPLRVNSLYSAMGLALYCAMNWGMQIVVAKTGTPTMLGEYALGVAVTQPIITMAQLNLKSLQTTDSRRQFEFGHYLALRLLCLAVALPVFAIAAIAQPSRVDGLVVFLTGCGVAFDAVSDIYYGFLQRRERFDRIGKSMAFKGLLSLTLLAVLLHVSHNIVWGIFGSALASAVIAAFYDVPAIGWVFGAGNRTQSRAINTPLWDWAKIGTLLRLAIPLAIGMFLMSVTANAPRYFVQRYLGEHDLGLFSAIASLTVITRTVVIAIGSAMSARMADRFHAGDRRGFVATAAKLLLVGVAVSAAAPVAGALFGRPLITLVFSKEYAHDMALCILLLSAGGVQNLGAIIGFTITAGRYLTIQAYWTAAALVATAGLSVYLVPKLGLRGAALAWLLAMVVQALFGFAIVGHMMRRFPPRQAA